MDSVILENYSSFIDEHKSDLNSKNGVMAILTEDNYYQAYTQKLVEGMDENIARGVLGVLNRNRDVLLESFSAGAVQPLGWTVMSFPILCDIYAQARIAKVANPFPTNSPVVSIPRYRTKARMSTYDGTPVSEEYFPSTINLIRANTVEVVALPNTMTNILKTLGLPNTFRVSRKYFHINKITVSDNGAPKEIPVIIRPDSRMQLYGEFKFTCDAGSEVVGVVIGNLNTDTTDVQYSVTLTDTGSTGGTFSVTSATCSVRLVPNGTMNGRVMVEPESRTLDIHLDPNEDFCIQVPTEDIQDYNAIYKIDLIRQLTDPIKSQISLHKDFDLAFTFQTAVPGLKELGHYAELDLEDFNAVGGVIRPANYLDIFRNLAPKISYLMGVVYRTFQMYPTYICTGLKSAALLRSLQSFLVSMGGPAGSLGWSGNDAQFLKLEVLECHALPDDEIYLTTRAPENELEKTCITDLIYQPLYIESEMTDGLRRTFVRSRTSIEMVRNEGCALLKVNNIDKFIG